MYDELIKNLRHDSASALQNCEFDFVHDWMLKAADAIEELQKDLERSKDFEAFWQHEAEEALKKFQVAISNKPRWIPVTEQLPEDKERVLIFYWLSTKPKIPWYKVATFATKLCDVDDYDLYGKDHPGFYGSDSEYGYYEHTDVEYWMPLPEPPKEET